MTPIKVKVDGSNGLRLFSGEQTFLCGETAQACFLRFFGGMAVNQRLEPLFAVLLGSETKMLEPNSVVPAGATSLQVILTDLVSVRQYDKMIVQQWSGESP